MTGTESDPPDAGAAKRQRIAKLIARAGLCSRREAEAWVVAGRVSLNGTRLTSPAVDVSHEDVVLVDGAALPVAEKTRLFLFHKPRGLVTTDHDPEGRETVADYLRENWPDGPRVVTVGRLDINTEGLLLLTNDGGLARVLELPQTGWVRRYRVRAKGTADPAALDALAEGVTIDGVDYAGIEAKLDRVQGANTWLTMGLREGKNREIKRVLEHIGLEVNRLIRLSFGPFQLLDLPEGAVEEVRTRVLRDQLGASLAAKAGVDFGGVPAPQVPHPAPVPKPGTDLQRRGAGAAGGQRTAGDRERYTGKPRPDGRRPTPGREPRGEPPPKRERPASGPRKHVSAIRAEHARTPATGPRTRIERSATLDRRDRTVKVERLVSSGPTLSDACSAPKVGRRRGEDAPPPRPDRARRFDAGRSGPARNREPGDRGEHRQRSERPDRRQASSRKNASPSASGKRARIARSGPRREHGERSDEPSASRGRSRPPAPGPRERSAGRDARPPRHDQPDRRDAASRGPASPSSAGKREPFARNSPRPSSHRASEMPKGRRATTSKTAQNRPAGPRDAARTPKGPRLGKPAAAKPARRTRPPASRGGRTPPRGPSKPKR